MAELDIPIGDDSAPTPVPEFENILIYPPETELPDWEDLRGRAPDATGELSSEAFVRKLRDDWHLAGR